MPIKTSKVLHGEGLPRIVIVEDDAFATGTISNVNGNVVTFSSLSAWSTALTNRQIITENKYGSETRGKIISYDATTKKVTVDSWNNEESKGSGTIEIKNEVIDLPRTEELFEWFEILFEPGKVYWKTKKKRIKIEGFYYNCILNYEKYATQNILSAMQNVYNSERLNNFIFIPRRDNERVYYTMELSPDTALEFAQLTSFQGHKYVKLQFAGVDLLNGPNLRITKDNVILVGDTDGTIVADTDGTLLSSG